jgi:hypothetical protein
MKRMRSGPQFWTMASLSIALAGCGRSEPNIVALANDATGGSEASNMAVPSTAAFAWPSSLRVMGSGFPVEGAPCRRIGESAATVDFLDDSAMLIGCPGSAESEGVKAAVTAHQGRIVGAVDGVTLMSVPNAEMETAE